MTFDEFNRSLDAAEPPSGASHALTAMPYDEQGDGLGRNTYRKTTRS